MTTKIKKLTKLEAVRGFAAVYVVFHHVFSKGLIVFGKDISFLFRFGQEAVILFFLLSGFVIQYACLKSKEISFKEFFIKRFLRIYIPLVIIFVSNSLLLYLNAYQFTLHDFYILLGNLCMLQDISSLKPNVICEPFLGNSPLWSLSYEWWFYIIFILLWNKFKDKASVYTYVIGTFSALTYIFFPNFLNREFMYLIIWWIGTDLAKIYVKNENFGIKDLKVPLLYLLFNIIILAINVKVNNRNSSIGVSPFLELRHFSFALVVIIGALIWKKYNWIGFKQTFGFFEIIAPISFGIYISHWFLIVQANYLDFISANYFIKFTCYFLICLLYSYLVERILYVKLNRWIINKTLKMEKSGASTLIHIAESPQSKNRLN